MGNDLIATRTVPPSRSADHVLVHRPGVERVVETELPTGLPVGPAVAALARTASALRPGVPVLADVDFVRPLETTVVRLTGQVRDGTVDLAVRAGDTEMIRAQARFPCPDLPERPPTDALALPPHPVEAGLAYRKTGARHAVADVETRDAVLRAIRCCVPDATLVPLRIERLYPARHTGPLVVDARERSQDGDTHVFDVDLLDPAGAVVERWEGLTVRAVRDRDPSAPWHPLLIGGYLERALEKRLGGRRAIAVEPDPPVGDRRAQTDLAASRALGRPVRVRHRPDGKPEIDGASITASHGAGVTMVAVGAGRLGCDVETVLDRDARTWADLLGRAQVPVRDLVAAEAGESAAAASTRVWSALECLRKTGSVTQALTVDRVEPGGWVVLSAGDSRIATWVTTIADLTAPVVFAVLSGEE
ncbi:polyketide synthase dehydratase domain-containing protein [Actinokineospora fastidiosa]|uniref:Polyketide synthase dehydratase domain-containing protein n=1 Tax=Actinokineospora fastidiosa TaxID=1816 RepID=A0A918GSE9_9PSEU|nr:polyketide synthase dehydratase domain-containing protein [Actinokineospora fastidiosa]GGS57968.1 hypothetical protein GCM10010171_61250 [Actinokineospora fastidiosa]